MKLEGSIQEIKDFIRGFQVRDEEIKNTPVAGTTDVQINLNGKKISDSLEKCQNY